MRRNTSIGLAAAAVAMLCLASNTLGQTSTVGKISASPHNLNTQGYTINNNEVCLPCHTPHNANKDVEGGRFLWNHQVDLSKSYTLYNNAHQTRYGSTSSANPVLDEESRLCLSCHDGAIALDNYGGKTNGTQFMRGTEAIGLNDDLSDDHPVGIKYPGVTVSGGTVTFNATVGRGYVDPTQAGWSSGGVGGGSVKLVDMPDGGKGVGCGSCHTPHNSTYGFKRQSNEGSSLCLKCHDK